MAPMGAAGPWIDWEEAESGCIGELGASWSTFSSSRVSLIGEGVRSLGDDASDFSEPWDMTAGPSSADMVSITPARQAEIRAEYN